MINAIIEAISVALNGEFGDGCKIYTQDVKQGLTEPCFFVACIDPSHRLFRGNRYFRKNQFCIQYFPQDPQRANEECYAAADRLFFCLEHVTVDGDPVRGTKMRFEVVDDILNFFVNYDFFVVCGKTEGTAMEGFSGSVSVKGQVEQ